MSENKRTCQEVTITFSDKSKIDFYGIIESVEMEKERVVLFSWRNVKHDEEVSVTRKRMIFVDITKIRSIVERSVGDKFKLEEEVRTIQSK